MNTHRLALLGALLVLSACTGSGVQGPVPVAAAGPDQQVAKGEYAFLDGSRSQPAPGDSSPLTYLWTQVSGAPATIVNPATATTGLVVPRVTGALTFQLVVTGARASPADTTVVTVFNRVPIATAGPDLAVRSAWLATLDGRGSWDPDGDPLTFAWVQTAGPAMTLETIADGRVRFTAPAVQGVASFLLQVSDGESTSEDLVDVRLLPPGSNLPPTADAGPDRTVARQAQVTLSGAGTDPDGFPVTVFWEQVSGPAVALAGPGTPTVSFTAPAAEADLVFRFTVSDSMDAASDTVQVLVRDLPPVVTSLALKPAHPRTADDLIASAVATDPDGDPVVLSWTWRSNGVDVAGQGGPVFPASLTAKGDAVEVTVRAQAGTLTASASATVVIEDSPPVPSMVVPAEVQHGVPLTGQVTVVDPDGDPPPAGGPVLEFGPAGMTVAADGTLTWTPTLPMFDEALDVRFGVRAAGAPGAPLVGSVRVLSPGRPQAMRRGGIEIAAGDDGMRARDLDGDGVAELLVAGWNGVFELRRSGAGYAMAWMYPFLPVGVGETGYSPPSTAVDAADLDGDGRAEIFLGVQERLVGLDGVTRRELAHHDADAGEHWLAIEVADLDGDGRKEVAGLVASDLSPYVTTSRLVVLDAATLTPVFETTSLGLGRSLAIGNVDGDAALEVVTPGGYVYDGKTHLNEWAYGPGFGSLVAIGPVTAGGAPQIVGNNPVRGFSAELKSPLWEATGFGVAPFVLRDLDGDGADEILMATGGYQPLLAYRYVGGATPLELLFSLTAPGYLDGARGIAVGDLDGDGQAEIAWGGGAGSTVEDAITIAGPLTAAVGTKWQNLDPSQLGGPYSGAGLARIGGGRSRLVFQAPVTDSGYAGSRVVTLDPATGLLAVSPEIGSNWGRSRGLAVADVNGDAVDEVFLGADSYRDGFFAEFDLVTGLVGWKSQVSSMSSVQAVVTADMNGDGFPDLIGILGGSVWVHDVHGQSLVWKGPWTDRLLGLQVADLDGDGRPEIVTAERSRLVAWGWSAAAAVYLELASTPVDSVSTTAVGDCDGDGVPEIYAIIGGGYGSTTTVQRYDAMLRPLGSFTVTGVAQGLFVEDLGTGRKNLALAVSAGDPYRITSPHHLVAVDAVTGAEVWRSPPLWGGVSPDGASWFLLDGARRLALATSNSMYLTY